MPTWWRIDKGDAMGNRTQFEAAREQIHGQASAIQPAASPTPVPIPVQEGPESTLPTPAELRALQLESALHRGAQEINGQLDALRNEKHSLVESLRTKEGQALALASSLSPRGRALWDHIRSAARDASFGLVVIDGDGELSESDRRLIELEKEVMALKDRLAEVDLDIKRLLRIVEAMQHDAD